MNEKPTEPSENKPLVKVRLPGFVSDSEVGLGDVVKRMTQTFGIRPCGGCERRTATLNRWAAFTGRSK